MAKNTFTLFKGKDQEEVSPAITHFPSPISANPPQLSNEEKIDKISDHFRQILQILGLNTEDGSIKDTPRRVAKMYVEEVFSGLHLENFPDITFFDDDFHHEHKANTVFVKVGFTSFCEHHFVPLSGFAYIAYIPESQLIGLSKIPRIVRYFAKRPQVQERLTAQIADSLCILLNSENVAVSISAKHYCVIARGVEDENSNTITNVLRGKFNTDDSLRREFFESINRH